MAMLSYLAGAIPIFLFLLASPLGQLFLADREPPRDLRRPQQQPPAFLNQSLLALDGPDDVAPSCARDAYAARVLSRRPLVIYLQGFLTEEERAHLLSISEPLYKPSTITHDAQSTLSDTTVRNSHVALLPRTDTVRCIEARARALQGWRANTWLERLRTQRYGEGGHYAHHFDWSGDAADRDGWGRVSSFMAWVEKGDGLEGGATEFPHLMMRRGEQQEEEEWCEFVVCGEQDGREGTTFKVVPGNAVYWENFAPDGRGYEETWHAGLPVTRGSKVGLNIWTYGRIE